MRSMLRKRKISNLVKAMKGKISGTEFTRRLKVDEKYDRYKTTTKL